LGLRDRARVVRPARLSVFWVAPFFVLPVWSGPFFLKFGLVFLWGGQVPRGAAVCWGGVFQVVGGAGLKDSMCAPLMVAFFPAPRFWCGAF